MIHQRKYTRYAYRIMMYKGMTTHFYMLYNDCAETKNHDSRKPKKILLKLVKFQYLMTWCTRMSKNYFNTNKSRGWWVTESWREHFETEQHWTPSRPNEMFWRRKKKCRCWCWCARRGVAKNPLRRRQKNASRDDGRGLVFRSDQTASLVGANGRRRRRRNCCWRGGQWCHT